MVLRFFVFLEKCFVVYRPFLGLWDFFSLAFVLISVAIVLISRVLLINGLYGLVRGNNNNKEHMVKQNGTTANDSAYIKLHAPVYRSYVYQHSKLIITIILNSNDSDIIT